MTGQLPLSHSHRYRIAEANGPTSEGICSTCGATRQFKNSDTWGFVDAGDWKAMAKAHKENGTASYWGRGFSLEELG